MRKFFLAAFALVSLTTLAGMQPAAAGCTQVCVAGGHSHHNHCHQQCTNISGSGPVKTLQEQKLLRQF